MTKEKNAENKKPNFKTISEVLYYIQMNLKAPKNQYSKFGNYYYRSCEDILDGLKQVLPENAYVMLSDEILDVAGTVYVKATAFLCFGDSCISNTAYAREVKEKPKFDASQLTGSASSYARKYALNGLFLIDDVKDADATKDADMQEQKKERQKPPVKKANPLQEQAEKIASQLKASETEDVLQYVWNGFKDDLEKIKAASPDKAYPTLEDIYQKKLNSFMQEAPDEGYIVNDH